MNILPLLAAPAALALALASNVSRAEETAKAAAPIKPNASVTSKAAKPAAQAPAPSNAATAGALNERANSKAVTPAAIRNAPADERSQKSCHGDASDA